MIARIPRAWEIACGPALNAREGFDSANSSSLALKAILVLLGTGRWNARDVLQEGASPLFASVEGYRLWAPLKCPSLAVRQGSRTPRHKRILETQEVKDIADERAGAGVAVAGVGHARDETVLEAQEVKDVKCACAR
jgi:hypothetical protein